MHTYLPGTPGNPRDRIRDLLRERNMTQAALAEAIGISESAFNRFMSGQTNKLSCESLVGIANIFHVSTDFLLCLTDIPYRTNYDIEALGLSAGAAEKLCSGELNAETVSQLLEHPLFAKLVNQITQFKDATIAASLAGMNAMLSKLGQLMHQVGKKSPALQKAAIQAAQDMESLKHPLYTDTSAMEATFLELVADLKNGARSYMMQFQKLTSTAVVKLVQQVQRHGGRIRPKGITPEQMVDAILDTAEGMTSMDSAYRAALRAAFLPLFKQPEE